jgi:hypothetical protein
MTTYRNLSPFGLQLDYPRSLGVYDDYARAQRVIDHPQDLLATVPQT